MGDKQHDPDKERVFVRALQGAYSLKDELARLRAMPRVIKGKDLKLDGGPQHFSRHYVEPEDGRTQTLHIHLEEYAPGAKTQKEPARALVIKTKPMYLFMNMLFQHTVEKRPKTPSATQGNFVPRHEEEDHNHPHD